MMYHRYPLRSLMWDYVRASAGFLIAAVPIVIGDPGTFFFIALSILAALFFGYGLRTLRLHLTAYEIRPDGIVSHGPFKRFHAWDTLSRIHLRYYSTTRDKNRRDLKRGWLELKITSPALARLPLIDDTALNCSVPSSSCTEMVPPVCENVPPVM